VEKKPYNVERTEATAHEIELKINLIFSYVKTSENISSLILFAHPI